MQSKKEKAQERLRLLRELLPKKYKAEDGNLVPNNQKDVNEIKKEIDDIEKEYPEFKPFI